MTTIITRLYADTAAAQTVVAALLAEGPSSATHQVITKDGAGSAAERMHAARIGAELALRLDRVPLASAMYAAVLADKAVPWAKLGLARVLDAAADLYRACNREDGAAGKSSVEVSVPLMGRNMLALAPGRPYSNAKKQVSVSPPTVCVRAFWLLARRHFAHTFFFYVRVLSFHRGH